MNLIDIVILSVAAIGAINGFRKGLIMEVVSLLALFLAVIGGFQFLHWGIAFLSEHFELSGKFVPLLAFLMIFVVIVLAVHAVGKLVHKLVHMVLLGTINRLAGATLGVLKFVFFLSLVVWAFEVFGVALPDKVQQGSYFYPYLVALGPTVVDLLGYILPFATDVMEKIAALLAQSV